MVFILPPLLTLTIIPILNEGVELPRSIVLILFALTYILIKPKLFINRPKIIYLPFIIPVAYLVSAIINDQNILSALFGGYKRNFGILTYIAVSILFVISSNLGSYDIKKFYGITLLPIVIFSILYSLVQISRSDLLVWGESDRVVLTLGNSNYAASFIALLLPTLLYGIYTTKKKILKFMNFFIFILLFICGTQTKSFQFFVVAIITISSFFFILFYQSFVKIAIRVRVLVSVVITIIAVFVILKNYRLLNEYTSADDRLSQQRAGLEIFRDNFFFGVGIDNLRTFMPLYTRPEDIRREGGDIIPDKTHNVFIDHFANGGIFTGAAYLAFIIIIFYFIFRCLKNGKAKDLGLALSAAIFIGYVFQLLINTDSILNMVIPYIAMGFISRNFLNLNGLHNSSQYKTKVKNITQISISTILIVVSFLSARIISTEIDIRGIMNNKLNDPAEIIEVLDRWPNPRPTEQVMVKFGQNLTNCALVIKIADRLLVVDNRSGQAWFAKCLCADAANNQEIALKYIKYAVKLNPMSIRYLDAQFQLESFLGYKVEAEQTKSKITDILQTTRN